MSQAMIADVNADNFQELVLQNSKRLPVLINFWSARHEQSKLANTILEKLAQEMAGQFILAKINFDQQADIVKKFGVPGLPFYKLIKNGELVTESAGLFSEAAYRSLLQNNIVEEPSEVLRKQASQAFQQGNFDQAVQLLGEAAKTNANNFKIHLDLVQMYLHTGHLDKASELFQKLPEEAQQDPQGKYLAGILFFSEVVNASPDIQHIQATLAQQPNQTDALYPLAGYLILNGKIEVALQTLFKLFTIDRNYQDGAPHKAILKVFEMFSGSQAELVTMYRRKFQSLLY